MADKVIDHGQIDNSSVEPVEPLGSVHFVRKRTNDSQLSLKEPETKKQKLITSIDPVFQSNIPKCGHSTETAKSFSDLPIEMLDEIFKSVATSDLLNCRRVTRQWNEVSSRIIRGRDDITLCFQFRDGKFVQKISDQHCKKMCVGMSRLSSKSLADLLVCIHDPEQFPFTSYGFDALPNLEGRDMRHFLTVFGKKIRSLKVYINDSERSDEILRKLVFEYAPDLKILDIGFWTYHNSYSENSTTSRILAESIHQLQIPELDVLRFDNLGERHTKIIEAILIASPNLKSISIQESQNTTENLKMLSATKKLHCLKDLEIKVTPHTIEYWMKSMKCTNLQLKSLDLKIHNSVLRDHQLKSAVTEMINQLFQSIKESLQTLKIYPLGLLTGLVFPKFKNVQRLCLQNNYEYYQTSPSLLDWTGTFPNIKEFDISFGGNAFDSLFLHEPLEIAPTIETLRISGGSYDIAKVMKFAPNVKTLLIKDDASFWFRGNGICNFKDISTYFPKVENIGWQICTGIKSVDHAPFMYKLDATITGLPDYWCETLAEKFRHKDDLSANEGEKYVSKRRQASINDLKGLKRFHVDFIYENGLSDEMSWNVRSDGENSLEDKAGFDPQSNLYKSGFTKVSKFLGFDLIPNLEVTIHKDFDLYIEYES